MNKERILLVDDEQAVLDGLRRKHRKEYNLIPACGPAEGLKAISEAGPFAIVVTDFQMPGMNGTQFLAKAREIDSEMIPIMLTGQADLNTAVEAVNRGHIFRFLNKPCDPEIFTSCLESALEHHRLRHAEKDLLEKTVRGSIEVLCNILSLSNPVAFGKAMRIRGLVQQIVKHLELTNGWQYETAAMLSQIGCVAVPDAIFSRMAAGEELNPDELAMYERHPKLARELLMKIPRLQTVAEIVSQQSCSAPVSEDRAVVIGARMLRAVLDFEEYLSLGASHESALNALRACGNKYDKGLLAALASVQGSSASDAIQSLSVDQLSVGMLIREDVYTTAGKLIVARGLEISAGSLQRLKNYSQLGSLQGESFKVSLSCADPGCGTLNAA